MTAVERVVDPELVKLGRRLERAMKPLVRAQRRFAERYQEEWVARSWLRGVRVDRCRRIHETLEPIMWGFRHNGEGASPRFVEDELCWWYRERPLRPHVVRRRLARLEADGLIEWTGRRWTPTVTGRGVYWLLDLRFGERGGAS